MKYLLKYIICFLIIFLFFNSTVFCRKKKKNNDKKNILKEKKILIGKVKKIKKVLSKINKKTNSSLSKLDILKIHIDSNKKIININNNHINSLNKNLKSKQNKIQSLTNRLLLYKKNYSEMIYQANKSMNLLNKVVYIISSDTFNQMFRKIQYMNQYNKSRRDFLKKIKKAKTKLRIEKKLFQKKKHRIKLLLNENKKEKQNLLKIKNDQIEIINVLNKKRNKLKKNLLEQNNAINRINKLLNRVIKDDRKKYKNNLDTLKKYEHPKKEKKSSKILTEKKIKITKKRIKKQNVITNINDLSFLKNKGKLPWPVKGFISKRYGINPHPILKNVKVDNHGVEIQTEKDEKVLAVFQGIVKVVAFVPGMQQVIIIKHGNYHTVYARLIKALVKVGDTVRALQPLGIVFTKDNNTSVLQFQIRKGMSAQTLNPSQWLMKN